MAAKLTIAVDGQAATTVLALSDEEVTALTAKAAAQGTDLGGLVSAHLESLLAGSVTAKKVVVSPPPPLPPTLTNY